MLGMRALAPRRSRPLRARRRRPGARRRHELAPVPGGAREARPRVLRVLVPQRVRGDRRARRCTAAPRPSGSTRCSTSCDGELDRLVADGGVTERELDGAKGHLTGSLALSLESSSSRMHRIGRSRAHAGRGPDARRGGRAGRRGHRRRRRPGRSTGCSATGARTLAVVGPVRRVDLARRVRSVPPIREPMIRVGVFGAGGRMGATVCQAVLDEPELELVAAVDPHHAGIDLRQLGVDGAGPAGRAERRRARSTPAPRSRSTSPWSTPPARTSRGAPTTACTRSSARRVRAPTTSTSSAPRFERVERQRGDRAELRHRRGADDALRRARRAVLRDRRDHRAPPRREGRRAVGHRDATAERMAAASADWAADPTTKMVVEGARGGAGAGGHPRPLGAPARARRAPGGAARHDRAVAHRSATTPTTARRSCPACCSRSRAVARAVPASPIGLDALLGL